MEVCVILYWLIVNASLSYQMQKYNPPSHSAHQRKAYHNPQHSRYESYSAVGYVLLLMTYNDSYDATTVYS